MVAVNVPSSKGRTSDFDSDGAGSNPAGAAIFYTHLTQWFRVPV